MKCQLCKNDVAKIGDLLCEMCRDKGVIEMQRQLIVKLQKVIALQNQFAWDHGTKIIARRYRPNEQN